MKKIIIGISGTIVVLLLVFFNLRAGRGSKTTVQVEDIERRDVIKVVAASGNIQPRRRVNVSASAMGKVTHVAVEEGQTVAKGDFLLQIDPAPYQSSVEQLEAAVRGARATLDLEGATLRKARYDLTSAQQMHKKDFMSEDALRDAKVAVEIAEAREKAAGETLLQYTANLNKARHELDEVHIVAEMAGVIVALNVEEGESAIIGTINNPGTVLLTIADLAEMEAEVLVDETEVVFIQVGQEVSVSLDAYPDTTFAGTVVEVGNSAVRSQLGMGQESVDFKVVIRIDETIPGIRPGLSASVDITVAEVFDAVAVPIQCLTVRDESAGEEDSTSVSSDDGRPEVEGVFVVENGEATFRRVQVGIAGESHFSVEWGLSEGETVVIGPFRAINDLKSGDVVKAERQSE